MGKLKHTDPKSGPFEEETERAEPRDPLSEFFVDLEEEGTLRPASLLSAAGSEAFSHADGRRDDYLSFMLADEEYAVPITALREVVTPLPITEVPRTPSYVLGVVTLRGTVLPVLDLRIKLNLPVGESGQPSRIVVLETRDGPAGVWVDRVVEVVRVGGENIEPPPSVLGGGTDLLRGIIRRDGRMLIVLDLDAALWVEGQISDSEGVS